jgi:hypothetical protein
VNKWIHGGAVNMMTPIGSEPMARHENKGVFDLGVALVWFANAASQQQFL